MKKKTIIVISIAMNLVMLSALGYISTLPIEVKSDPAVVRYVTNAAPAAVSLPLASTTSTTPVKQ